MGTTPTYGLPYPESTDLVIQGDDAIQALAEATEDQFHAILDRSYATTNTGPGQVVLNTIQDVQFFEGEHTSDLAWELYGGSGGGTIWTYTGPGKWFLINAQVTIQFQSWLGSTVRLVVGGSYRAESSHRGPAVSGETPGLQHTHSLAAPVFVTSGQEIAVNAVTTATSSAYGTDGISYRNFRMVSLP